MNNVTNATNPRMYRWIDKGSVARLMVAASVMALISGCGIVQSTNDRVSKSLLAAEPGDAPERLFAVPVWRREGPADLMSIHAPVFLTESDWSAWNRIGSPSLYRDHKDRIVARVDPTLPAIYSERRSFTAVSGTQYTNLVYRVHFERVPLRFKPLYASAGRNPGLYVIVTLNADEDPVLYTTVHTCGCYLAIVPTDTLPASARPDDWAVDEQEVLTERLPGMLVVPEDIEADDRRLTITLRDGSHRVAAMSYDSIQQLRSEYILEPTRLKPMDVLDNLPVEGGGTGSLFAEDGYVRYSRKPLEVALVSWWTFDRRVGQDRRLGTDTDNGPRFYTSFKYSARDESDMRNFGRFLDHYGWKL